MEIIGNPWDSSDSSFRKSWPLDFNPLCCITFFLCLGPKQRHADILNPSLQDLHQLKLSKFWVNLVTSDPWLSRISFSGMQGVAQAVADPNRAWNVSFLWSSVASLSCGTPHRRDHYGQMTSNQQISTGPFLPLRLGPSMIWSVQSHVPGTSDPEFCHDKRQGSTFAGPSSQVEIFGEFWRAKETVSDKSSICRKWKSAVQVLTCPGPICV